MRALLDVNVLLALLDEDHVHHGQAMNWLVAESRAGWASCPLTQNGCIRIMSQSAYRNARPPAEVAARLGEATQDKSHRFWPDSISLLGHEALHWERVLTSRQITDAYLLSLAVAHKGRLVTLDRGIAVAAVAGASARHLVVLG